MFNLPSIAIAIKNRDDNDRYDKLQKTINEYSRRHNIKVPSHIRTEEQFFAWLKLTDSQSA